MKLLDPSYIDAYYCLSAVDWIISQLLIIGIGSIDEVKIGELILSILEKKLPFVEKFDDGTLIFLADLPLKDKILLALYMKHPNRVSNKELCDMLKNEGKKKSILAILSHLHRKEKLIHRNEAGAVLTRKGIDYVEKEILSKIHQFGDKSAISNNH